MQTIVVVGANHAGTAAINTILDNYKDKSVVAIDSNSNISFLGCGMALWIGKQIDGPEGLFYSNRDILTAKGAQIKMETKVERIDFDTKTIHFTEKNGTVGSQAYDKLILATGSVPIVPPIEGTELKNVQFVKLFQNAQEVIDKLSGQEIKHVTVVGAGYIGVELAEAFQRLNKKVTIIEFAQTCLSGYYDPEFTELMTKNLLEHGIELQYNQKVTKIVGNGKVEKIITDKGEYQTDMVILGVGFKPNTMLGHDKLDLFKNGAYVVNLKQQTNIKDVYAIGDCATVYDNATQGTNYIALASNAVRSGIVAAHNACGTGLEGVGVQGSNGISIYDLKMVSTGLTLNKAKQHGFNAMATEIEDYQRPQFMRENEKVLIKIVYDADSRRILGAQMASKYDVSMAIHMFSLAIQEKLTIDKLKLLDIFFLPHFNQPYNYVTKAALSAK